MSRTYKDSPHSRHNRPRRTGRQRTISVRAVRRDPPDLRKFSRALIQLALEDAAAVPPTAADPTTDQSTAESPVTPQDEAHG